MIKIEDVEDFYNKEIGKIDKEFLDKGSKALDKKEKTKLEVEYKIKSRNLREEYEKKVVAYLKEQKQAIGLGKNKMAAKIKKDDFKKFEVKKLDLKDTWKNKLKFKWELFKFKYKINSKRFNEEHTPANIKIFIIKVKISLRNSLFFMSKFISDLFARIKKIIFKIFIKLKEINSFILTKSKNLIKWFVTKISLIFSKIFKKKKEVDNPEKRPDEEIAERLLKRDK